MPRGDKSSYTDKQKRQAAHIAQGYKHGGTSPGEAERRAWATVNAESGGGRKSGSGRAHPEEPPPARKVGHLYAANDSHEARSEAAKKGWETRRRRSHA